MASLGHDLAKPRPSSISIFVFLFSWPAGASARSGSQRSGAAETGWGPLELLMILFSIPCPGRSLQLGCKSGEKAMVFKNHYSLPRQSFAMTLKIG